MIIAVLSGDFNTLRNTSIVAVAAAAGGGIEEEGVEDDYRGISNEMPLLWFIAHEQVY